MIPSRSLVVYSALLSTVRSKLNMVDLKVIIIRRYFSSHIVSRMPKIPNFRQRRNSYPRRSPSFRLPPWSIHAIRPDLTCNLSHAIPVRRGSVLFGGRCEETRGTKGSQCDCRFDQPCVIGSIPLDQSH